MNLLSVIVMLRLGFRFAFESTKVDIFLGMIYYGSGFISNGLMVLALIILVLIMSMNPSL